MVSQKRGQLSGFLIVALLILVAGAVIILLWKYSAIFHPERAFPKETVPLKRYVETCLSNVAEEGIFLLESHAGYIDPDDRFPDIAYDPYASLDGPPSVPMWYHDGEDRVPSKRDMATQLEEWIRSEFDSCIGDLEEFKQVYELEEIGDRDLSVTINDESVVIKLIFPLEVRMEAAEKTEQLNEFTATLQTSLGKLHSLALILMDAENQQGFLEVITDEVIASSEYLPYEGVEFSCKPKSWPIRDIESYIKDLVALNIQFVTFQNTQRVPWEWDYYDKLFTFQVTDQDFSDVSVRVNYDPSWPMEVDVIPRKGNQVRPIDLRIQDAGPVEYLMAQLMGMCVKLYHHKYSVNYPALFELRDSDNPSDFFFFATPVFVTNNEPDRQGLGSRLEGSIDEVGSMAFCANQTIVNEFAIDPTDGRILEYDNVLQDKPKVSMRVMALDYYTDEPVFNASISYHCARYLCDIGTTRYPIVDGYVMSDIPILEGEFPICIGGYVIAEAPGYHMARRQQSALPENDDELVRVYVPRLKSFQYGFRVLEKDGNGLYSRELEGDESVVAIVKNELLDFERVLFYPAEHEQFQDFDLMMGDFTYSVEIRLMDGERVIGGAEYQWRPSAGTIATADYALFFVVAYPNAALDDPSSPEWQFVVSESKKHNVTLL